MEEVVANCRLTVGCEVSPLVFSDPFDELRVRARVDAIRRFEASDDGDETLPPYFYVGAIEISLGDGIGLSLTLWWERQVWTAAYVSEDRCWTIQPGEKFDATRWYWVARLV